MPAYDGGRWIAEALESILDQSFRDFELIVLDNASTDDTGQIAEAYAVRDARVRYVRQPTNVGPHRQHARQALAYGGIVAHDVDGGGRDRMTFGPASAGWWPRTD
jgi:glycosyltransferase involved in cell wall biosynthesis